MYIWMLFAIRVATFSTSAFMSLNRSFVYLELLEANLPSIEPPNNQEVASATDQGHLAQKLSVYSYQVNKIKIKNCNVIWVSTDWSSGEFFSR